MRHQLVYALYIHVVPSYWPSSYDRRAFSVAGPMTSN